MKVNGFLVLHVPPTDVAWRRLADGLTERGYASEERGATARCILNKTRAFKNRDERRWTE